VLQLFNLSPTDDDLIQGVSLSLYCTGSLHRPGYPTAAAVFRSVIKDTHCMTTAHLNSMANTHMKIELSVLKHPHLYLGDHAYSIFQICDT
jgi:hypothetical protein